MAKKKDTIENVVVCQGAVLSKSFFDKKENRLLTLLLKGFIVYLLSMGSIGFYLSSFQIAYNVLFCHIAILVVSMCCAMLYYRLLVENLGYLVLLVAFGGLVFVFRDYINSGFYAIVNITVENASQYFEVDIQRMYNERIGNRYITVTMVALFIGFVLDILLNVYVSRRMQYVTAIFIIMSLNLIPLYLVMEPDLLYVIMMFAGISMAVCFKAGRHYSPQISVKRDSRVFKLQGKKKKELSYVYDVKVMVQAGVWAICIALFTATIASVVKPKETFNVGYKGNKYKDLSMAAMSTLLVDGLSGFYRTHTDIGGLDSGKLGSVSSIRVDNETDLLVQMTPYTDERVYLKNFVGVRYNPYENTWTNIVNMNGYDVAEVSAEAQSLRDAFEAGDEGSARAVMKVRNVGLPYELRFEPYYTEDVQFSKGTYNFEYYPRTMENNSRVNADYYGGETYYAEDLYVPEENIEAIEEFVGELGYIGTDEQIIEAVKAYYQEYFPYTIRPGRTPRKQDFVNYFLTYNQKGYCAHFASSAVLIFRYLGIPARYVEGYAIDFNQVLDGELVEGADYSDYYEGYSEIGDTALVEVNVADADAHAWVEVYDVKKGWYPVDVTPTSFEEEEEVTDFWEDFADMMGDGDSDAGDDITDGTQKFVLSDDILKKVNATMGVGLLLLLLVFGGRKLAYYILFLIHFNQANINDKLIMKYSLIVKRKKRNKTFAKMYNYEDQIKCLIELYKEREQKLEMIRYLQDNQAQVVDVLDRAGFSNQMISQEEYTFVLDYLKKCQ